MTFFALNKAAGLGAAALVALTAGPVLAQDVTWTFNNNYAPTRPESEHIRQFAADIEALSEGRMELSVSEGGAMGLADADALRYMQVGTPEMAFIWPPFLGRDAPELANVYVFGLIASAEEHLQALPAVQEVLTEGLDSWGIEVVGFMGLSIIDASIFCREPVQTLDELREVKLRVGTREQVETFSALGVAAQIVPQNDLYSALQTGVIDCALYPVRFAGSISVQEVAPHATPVGFPFPPAPYAIMANRDKWTALDPDLQAVVLEAAAALEERSFDFTSDAEAEVAARELTASQGVTWYPEFSEEEKAEIRAAALETWETLATEAGDTALDYRQRILDAL